MRRDVLTDPKLPHLRTVVDTEKMARHFAACVNANAALMGPDPELAVARTLDAARRSLHAGGRAVEV
jgi:hypothetical protein